ncbi:Zn-dependent hydrolase [Halorubrum kocurii]|uniref:Amidase n=1 Tax=Halorubrum kocurii JCM 14978 TaxID=1230456 RepID=M0P5M2_9EURY|nr:Zn-dependent hydrolase [Halorubrum kocurii]EMA64829.1 amidase [Halorubrum kocurii JCM 14978]
MHVDRERLRRDITETGAFGAIETDEGHGRTVLTGSEADRDAREYLVDALEAAGMDVRVDPVGNVAGRWVPDGADPDAGAVALGSHLDSVPRGGIFDGPLGVFGALEAVRAIRASDREPLRPLEVVSFTEEEGGRFGIGTLGSSVAAGDRSAEAALALEDDEGESLADRLSAIGFRGEDRLAPAAWDAWLELHVEQGTRLEAADASVGVVDAITGITNCRVVIEGTADHAGATPMDERTDALVAAGAFVQRVSEAASAIATEHPAAVATVGDHVVEPNVRNVIPGRVTMELDIRGVTGESIDELVDRIRAALGDVARAHSVEASLDRFRDDGPTEMTGRCVAAATDAADAVGLDARRFHSAAMHDTANVARVTDAGLLFAPSEGGVSHTPREWTDWDDCAAATRALAGAAARLAGTEPT